MGNKIQEESIIKKAQYKPNEFKDLMEKIKLLNEFKSKGKFYNNIDLDNKLLNEFSNEYEHFDGIERFFIPIIGAINSGKSTFINSFLPFTNVLEMGEKVTTKFICIIRHKKDNQTPEIYNVEIKKRNEYGFNFIEKGDNLYSPNKNLSDIIKEKNKEIKENYNSENYLINPENYFLIIKMNIPIFQNDLEEYGELIDFLDIPGLDEADKDNNNGFDDFIKIIFSNILFSIFIFDATDYNSDGPKQVLENYLEYLSSIYEANQKGEFPFDGLFILNKIDLLEEEGKKEIYNDFMKNFKKLGNSHYVSIDFNDNNFIKISAKQLCLEGNGSNISLIANELYKELINEGYNSFRFFIKNYFKIKFEMDIKEIENKINESSINDNIRKSLNKINSLLKKKCPHFKDVELTIKEFVYLSQYYSKKNKQNIYAKEFIQKKIKNNLDKFLNFKYDSLYEKIKEEKSIISLAKNSNNKNDDILLYNHIEKEITNKIYPILKNGEKKIKDIANFIDDFEEYRKNKKIRICFFGKVSSGKTSLLNSIIGNNLYLLQSSQKECTKSIFIIKYSKEEIKFCESQLIKNKYGNYFKDIENTTIRDKSKIINKIKSINNTKNIKYYSLYVPIESFNDDSIELIDLPGITQNILEDQINLLDLDLIINMCDGFIFSLNRVSVEDINSKIIFENIIRRIKMVDNFDFRNCLFVLTHRDEITENLKDKIEDLRKEIKNIFNKYIFSGTFNDRILIRDKILFTQNLKISSFSNKFYQQFQRSINKIKTLEILDNKESLKQNIINLKEEYGYVDNNEEEKFDTEEIENKKKKIIIKYGKSNLDSEIVEMSKIMLSILKNYEQLPTYKNSGASEFFKNFKDQLLFSKEYKDKILNEKYQAYIIKILFTLLYFHNICSDNKLFLKKKKEIESKKENIKKEFINFITKYQTKFEEKRKNIKILEENLNKTIGDNKTLSKEEIKEIIISEKIDKRINEIIKKVNYTITHMRNNFIKYCLKQIKQLFEELNNFGIIIEKIAEKFKPSSFFKGAAFSGGGILGVIVGCYLDDVAIAAGLAFATPLTIICSVGVAVFGIGYISYKIYQNNKSNSKKIHDYFEEIFTIFEELEKRYIDLLKEKKEQYLKELDQLSIDKAYIKYLNKNGFNDKMNMIIESIKSFS